MTAERAARGHRPSGAEERPPDSAQPQPQSDQPAQPPEPAQPAQPPSAKKSKKAIYKNVKEQLEFYFSDAALTKDRFLGRLVTSDPEGEGWVPLDVFLTFNKIKENTTKVSDLAKAISFSTDLVLDEGRTKVKRKTPLVPYDADGRTVYAESVPSGSTIRSLTEVFQTYGPVAYVSLPKYRNTGKIKGFAFIEFKTSEDAQNCLEAFTAMGRKLPNTITAEELLTCTTYQKEDDDESDSSTKKRENPSDDELSEENATEEPPSKQSKDSEKSKSEIIESNVKKPNSDREKVTKRKNAESSDISESDGTPVKKKKRGDASKGDENVDMEKEQSEGVDGAKPVRKRNKRDRKKKIKSKEKQSVEDVAKSMQVLSKAEWKVLRNKYLNMQRKHMKALKQVLRTRHTLLDNTPNLGDHERNPVKKAPAVAHPAIQFVEGVIVAVQLSEPCVDVKNFKKSTKANVHVKYVDIKEGQSKAHIRFDNPEFAKQFTTSGIFSECHILTGQEEKDYWEELSKSQSSDKRKIRGRDRLVNKAQELAAKCGHRTPATQAKHIRFDD